MLGQKLGIPVAVTPPTDEGLAAGVEWCLEQDEEWAIQLVTATKGAVEGGTILGRLASADYVEHHTLRGGLRYGHGPALVYVPLDIYEVADAVNAGRPTALCVASWAQPEIVPWAQMVGAIALAVEDPDGARWDDPIPHLADEVTEELHRITRAINHNNHLSGPREKRDTVRGLERIRDAGFRPDPLVVMAWAAANGWSGKNIKVLGKWVERVNSGGRLTVR